MKDENDVVAGVTPYFEPDQFPPLSATVQAAFGACSRPGPGRTNTDHFAVLRLGRNQETLLTSLPDEVIAKRFDEYGYAMVVADGVGAAGGAERASHLAIATLVYLIRHFAKWNLRVDDAIGTEIMARAERFYRHIDSTVAYEQQRGSAATAQTTLTATYGAGRDLFFAHVGHSRAYLFRDGQLMRLTRDHTIGRSGQSGVPLGPMIDINTTARDLRHILTDTMGMTGPVGPGIDLERLQLDDGDRVLVCTNGLTDAVEEAKIAEILADDATPDAHARTLVDLAMASGGEDDATALVGRYHVPD
ncbi:MAG TPA: protein phosphatase 2C domain-containing protein [Vicinamibacterales bacterium]|jgi:protein phosphatase